MPFDNYTRVMLVTDRYLDQGVISGDIGYIIEVYGDGNYEIEFSLPDGTTRALVVVHEDEIQLNEPGLVN